MLQTADARARLLREAVGCDGPVEPTAHDWERWVDLAMHHRVLPLLHSAANRHDWGLLPEHVEQADAIQLDAMTVAVRIEHDLLMVADLLGQAEVEFVVLKGLATAHLDFAAPTLRQFADADILVPSADLPRAVELLSRQGWHTPYALPRGHDEFAHAITMRNDNRSEIDIHRRLAHRGLGELVPTQPLFEHRVHYSIAGRDLWALSQPDRLIHAAIHAMGSQGSYRRLSALVDVLVLATGCSPSADLVLERADRWRVMPIAAAAVNAAYSTAQLPLPERWESALRRRPERRDRLVEFAYLSSRRHPLAEELAYQRLLPTMGHRYRYLRGHLLTGPDYRAKKNRRTIAQQAKYLLSRVRAS